MASLGQCPTLLVAAALAGCASTQALETATANAQGCEQARAQAQADADRGVPNAQAWADKIAVDCRAWRDQVAIEQARLDANTSNRRAAGGVLAGYGAGLSAAGTSRPDPPTYRCHGNYIGGVDCRPR